MSTGYSCIRATERGWKEERKKKSLIDKWFCDRVSCGLDFWFLRLQANRRNFRRRLSKPLRKDANADIGQETRLVSARGSSLSACNRRRGSLSSGSWARSAAAAAALGLLRVEQRSPLLAARRSARRWIVDRSRRHRLRLSNVTERIRCTIVIHSGVLSPHRTAKFTGSHRSSRIGRIYNKRFNGNGSRIISVREACALKTKIIHPGGLKKEEKNMML